ncbi:MAG: hypothetical protein AB1586_10790 [Pseudomonadota bacterium]|jgi:hypothetical protein
MIRHVLAILLISTPAAAQDQGPQLWSKIYEVFSHPRCANCHVGPDNVPIWSGSSYGPKPRPHGMNINAGMSRIGAETIACGTCHGLHNSQVPHGPPGAQEWLLPPPDMQWFGKSSAEICAQIKDPARNGGRTIDKIAEHIAQSEVVHWGWAPGPGREPAPSSAAQLVEFVREWGAAGAPCPTQ